MANSNNLKDNGFRYTKAGCENQQVVVIEPEQKHSQLVDNGDCTYLHISGDGDVTIIDADPNINIIDNCDGVVTFSWKDHDPVVVDICKIVGDNCNATLIVNPDNTLTFTDNAGNITNIVIPNSQLTDNGDGTVTHISGDGTITVINLCNIVAANCTDQLVNNMDGSFTHIAVDGIITTIPAPPVASIVNNGNYTYTFNDGLGNTTLIDVNEIDLDIVNATLAGSVITFTSEDGSTIDIDICAVVSGNCNATLVENVDGSWTFTDNAGVSTTSSVPAESSLVDNLDGTATHVSGSGNVTILDICQMMIDGGCDNTDSLVDNGNGTFTHTAVDGTVTVVNMNARPASDIVDNGDGTFTHTNGDGVAVLLDVCQSIAANCNATIVVNGDGTFTHTDNAGVINIVSQGGEVLVAGAPFVSTNNVSVGIGESYVSFPNGDTWARGINILQNVGAGFVSTNGILVNPGDWYIDTGTGQTWAS